MATSATPDHRAIISGLAAQLREVFDRSPQGMYVYLDDRHKACNERFAQMLGYESAGAWDQPGAFTEQYVDEHSRRPLVDAYQAAMEHQVAATVNVTWKRRDGTLLPSSVILTPVAYDGELVALHFITPLDAAGKRS